LPAPPRVLHLIDSLRLGGAQRLVADIVSQRERDRFEFAVCCIQGWHAFRREFEELGVELHILDQPKFSLAPARLLGRLCRERRFDIIHAHLFQGCFWGAWLRRRNLTPHLVSHLHAPPFSPPWSAMEGPSLRRADMLIAVSSPTKAEYVRRHHLDEGRVRVIPNGIDTRRFTPSDRPAARAALGLDARVPLVGFVGRLARVKGVDILLEAFARVGRSVPEARLAVIGDGPEASRLRAMPEADGVVFLGTRDDVPNLMPGLDLLCVPSRDETFGIVALEALACRVPVVASRVGGLAEVVPPDAGLLVAPEDPEALAQALVCLLKDPATRTKMGEAGAAYVRERFDIRNTVHQIEGIYEGIMRR
jgi:glycosyltransferase involved in cell wall biosynthesis